MYFNTTFKSIIFCWLLALSSTAFAQSNTFCNPLNLDYGFIGKDSRHAADPVIVLFKNKYYLFTTLDGIGYRVSDNLIDWSYIEFNDETKKILNLKPNSGYLAPAVATDGQYIYFLRLANPETENDRSETSTALVRTDDPGSGAWEQVSKVKKISDPHILFDQGKIYVYHGLGAPTRVFQLDPKTFREIPGSEKKIIPDYSDEKNLAGWEDITEGGRHYPIREGIWVFKRGFRYYLTYATPGTASKWYSDGLYVSDSPEGPFTYQEATPASTKPGGFIGSAGHSCVFQDRYGNWLQVATMWIGISDQFERRVGIFPVSFDAQGGMHTLTEFGDYPGQMPVSKTNNPSSMATQWNLLTHSKNVKIQVSSGLPDHPAVLANDESVRTWWSAETGAPGEWLEIDMGERCELNAVQVNFAEQDCSYGGKPRPVNDYSQYKLYASSDHVKWQLIVDRSENKRGIPHDYYALHRVVQCRYLKIVNVRTACDGKFAIRELRAFGTAFGQKPLQVKEVRVLRDEIDARKVKIFWKPLENADGYLIRYGAAPDKLYAHFQVTDGESKELYLHTLSRNKDISYYFKIDAYNQSGFSQGQIMKAENSNVGYPRIENGTYRIVNHLTKMALDMAEGNCVQEPLNSSSPQRWIFEIQSDGSFKITNEENKHVLQIKADGKDRGTPLQLANWDGRDSQRWFVKFSEKGHIKLCNKNSWYYLEAPKGTISAGQQVKQNRYFDFPYQEWELVK